MSEIKLRAWDPVKMEMVFANVCDNDEMSEWITWEKPIDSPENTGVGFDIEQFIGINDCRGTGIYWGDVLESTVDHMLFKWLVCHNGWATVIKNISDLHIDLTPEFIVDSSLFFIDRVIIGNIHQNPELLK